MRWLALRPQPEAQGRRQPVAEGQRAQFTRTLHCVDMRFDPQRDIRDPAGWRFISRALGPVGQREALATRSQPRHPCHQG